MIKQLIIGSIILLSASSASYAGQDKQLSETTDGSMLTFGCVKCDPEPEVEEVQLEPGSQFLEVRKVGDDMKIYRTENWLGGSPVSYIHMPSNPNETRFSSMEEGPIAPEKANEPVDINPVASIEIDQAKPIIADISQGVANVIDEPEFDPASFELRLN